MTDDGGSAFPEGWYALKTRSRSEFAVARRLATQLEVFLPAYPEESRWSDRSTTIERPLFAGYLFARIDATGARNVLATPGVVEVLPSRARPERIPDREIDSLRRVIASRAAGEHCPYVAGETVTVARGPLAGVTGIVTRTRGSSRIVVGIEILRRAVSVEIDTEDLAWIL